jgi:predicted nuclease of predicted toxin-antitoxin system
VRLYLDQMLHADLAVILQAHGHDVVRASETGHARADDAEILAPAIRDQRTLITLDGHFGDWAVLPLAEHFGVIRIKAHPATTENITKVLLALLSTCQQSDFRNHLVIASAGRTRLIRTFSD